MTKWALAAGLVLALARTTLAADCSAFTGGCDPDAQCITMARTGLCKPEPCYCPYETPVRDFMQFWNDRGIFDTAGDATLILPEVTAADDDFEFFLPTVATTLVSVGCHCEINCGTPATLSFEDRGGNAIALTGGGDLTCGTGTSATTPTTFDTSDADRVLTAWEGLRLNVTNTPTTSQRFTLALKYTTP